MPKLNVHAWQAFPAAVHRLTGSSNGPYAEVVLGEQQGLSQLSVRLERLPPGSRSSFRHWHETEDEFVFVVDGELVLLEDEETTLRTGDAAAWKAGVAVGHCLENRSASPATLLVVGARALRGVVHYPDHDIVMHHDEHGRRYTRASGTPLPSDPSA
jgi:uncharacterized cupin superfamily protein